MTTLDDRLAQFVADRLPNDDALVELLCLDHNGTYVLPFLCRHGENGWRNSMTGEPIAAKVAGWRPHDAAP